MDAPPPSSPTDRGGILAAYLQEQFQIHCPAGWRSMAERVLLDPRDSTLLGYAPRADIVLERTDGARRLWIEFEISRADPAANHAKFATAHILRPWSAADAFISMISSHVARGRRNLGAGMIHVMRQVGIDAFQTLLLPDLDRHHIRLLNHDRHALHAAAPDVGPEIARALTVAEPVVTTTRGRLHFAADVFDVLLNLRRWNDEADDPQRADLWRRRAVQYVVLDPITGLCAPAKFAAYVFLPPRDGSSGAGPGIDSQLTFERYVQLDQAEPLFDGNRAWKYLTGRLGFVSHTYGESPAPSAVFDRWYSRRAHLLNIDSQRLTLLLPSTSFR